MRLNRMRRNGKLYVRILLGVTMSIVLVLFASSSIYYFSFTRILQEKAFKTDPTNLKQTGQSIAKATESAQTVSFQIYRNSAIAKILYYKNPHPFDVQAVMIELSNYLATMPYIQSIYIYNAAQERYYIVTQNGQKGVLQEDELQDQDMIGILDNYEQYKPFAPIPRTIETQANGTAIYTYLCYDAIGLDHQLNSAIVVNISADWVKRGINSNQEGTEQTFLVDDRNKVRSLDDLHTVTLSDETSKLFLNSEHSKSSDYVISDFEGVKSLLTFSGREQFDWRYIRVTPYELIVEEMKDLRIRTLQITSAILVTGFLLSWLLSRFLYRPINKIEIRMNDLESEKRNSSYTIRQNTLHKLIQIQDFDPQIQLEKLRSVGVQFDFTKPYFLVFLRIDKFDKLKGQGHKDVLTYKFAIMNIGTEICSKHFRVESVDLEEDGILMLLNSPQETHLSAETLVALLKEVQNACMEYLRLGVSIAVTPETNDPHQLHQLYKQVKETSLHRFFKGRGAIIEMDTLHIDNKAYSYPVGKEKRLIEALMAGKTDETKTLFSEILLETSEHPIHIAKLSVRHLSVALDSMLTEIERNGLLQLGADSDLVLPKFENYETAEELTAAFDHFFNTVKSRLVEKRSGKQEELIRKITDLIEQHYMDPNLSLNYIADELGMSSYHISRVFRQQTLTTIVDMINHVRMEHAKKLLIHSESSVSEIAEKTGYTSSSYFHRMFKKLYGVTPSEFRNSNQQ